MARKWFKRLKIIVDTLTKAPKTRKSVCSTACQRVVERNAHAAKWIIYVTSTDTEEHRFTYARALNEFPKIPVDLSKATSLARVCVCNSVEQLFELA